MKNIFLTIFVLFLMTISANAQNVPITGMQNGGTLQPTDAMHVARCSTAGCDYQVNTVGLLATAVPPLAINLGGTGTTSPALVAGTNVTITGTWPNQTINASGGGGGGSSPGGSTNSLQYNAGSSTFGGFSLTDSQIVLGQAGSHPLGKTMSGDCTISDTGAITCTSTNGSAFGALATLGLGSGLSSGGGNLNLSIPVSVASGGTNATSASITSFNNITGYTASGATGTTSTNLVFSTSPALTTPSFATAYGGSSAGSTLTFNGTSNGSPSNAYLLLNTNGQNVGIGTNLPLVGLDVNGTTHFEKATQVSQLNGDYNVSMCGNTFKPSWCSGTDIGGWINSAVTAIGTSYIGTIDVDPSGGPYSFSTQATVPQNIMVDCHGAELDSTPTTGAAFVLASAVASFTYENLGGLRNCHLLGGTITNSGGNGYRYGSWTTGTAIGVYMGGDPNGVLSPLTDYGVGFLLLNDDIEGFFTNITYGDNTWVDKLEHVQISEGYNGIVDPVPATQETITHFQITSNVVTITVSSNTLTSGVVYVTGLSTGTYLNNIPLTITGHTGSTITATFTHANVGSTVDSGTLTQGTPSGTSGEQMSISHSNIHDNQNCGMNMGGLGQWDILGTSFDYNATTPSATVNNICGTSINALDLYGVHLENTNGPMITISGNANVNVWGGSVFYGAGSALAAEHGVFHALGTAGIGGNSNSNSWSVHDLSINGSYVPTYIVYTNAVAGINLDVQGGSNYVPGASAPAITDAVQSSFPISPFAASGGISVGTSYMASVPPANGAIIQGSVGIGTATPLNNGALTVGLGTTTLLNNTTGAVLCLTTAHAIGHCTAAASCTSTCTCTCSPN